jgi:adenylate kinase
VRVGLFGLPGAGKGTQAILVAKHFLVPHISTGDMFRELQNGNSRIANEIREILAAGRLVPDEKVTELTFERLREKDCQNGFILDGYPRTLQQAKVLQDSQFALNGLIYLDIDRNEVIRRISMRRVCSQCKSVFGAKDLSGRDELRCPEDGGILIQRPDDRTEAVATRLEVYEKNLLPVIKFFESLDLLYRIDANGAVDEVFSRVTTLIKRKIFL